jgi:hypothetical protein
VRTEVPGIFAESKPKATARVIAGTAGKTAWMVKARPVAAKHRTNPGPNGDSWEAGLLKGMPQPCRMGARKGEPGVPGNSDTINAKCARLEKVIV